MRKILSLVILAQTLTVSGLATLSWDAKRYDENAPRAISEALGSADCVEVVSSFGKEEYRFRIDSKVHLIRLSMILGSASYEPRPLAWHVTRHQLDVYRKGVKTISIAQDGEKLRCFGAGLSGDYYVGGSLCDAVLKWANQPLESAASNQP